MVLVVTETAFHSPRLGMPALRSSGAVSALRCVIELVIQPLPGHTPMLIHLLVPHAMVLG